jgi:hypothetical protein
MNWLNVVTHRTKSDYVKRTAAMRSDGGEFEPSKLNSETNNLRRSEKCPKPS